MNKDKMNKDKQEKERAFKNNFRFFKNTDCEYFPCHVNADAESFNCLFCFCPLYYQGKDCGGNFKYSSGSDIKNCEACTLPHQPGYYDTIIEKLKHK